MRSGTLFQTREVVVLPGDARAYEAEDWRDALVVVQEGTIELEMHHGSRRTFVRGDAMWFDGLRLRLLRNRGSRPAVLLATSRRSGPFHEGATCSPASIARKDV